MIGFEMQIDAEAEAAASALSGTLVTASTTHWYSSNGLADAHLNLDQDE